MQKIILTLSQLKQIISSTTPQSSSVMLKTICSSQHKEPEVILLNPLENAIGYGGICDSQKIKHKGLCSTLQLHRQTLKDRLVSHESLQSIKSQIYLNMQIMQMKEYEHSAIVGRHLHHLKRVNINLLTLFLC